MEKAPSEREIFDLCGPLYLNHVDWSEPNHRRSIAASLIQGVYILERDRQQQRINHNALAPIWWRFFDFQLVQILEDHADSSIYGAIFVHTPQNPHQHDHAPPQSRPPIYVIAFRGNLLKPPTRKRDGHLSAKFSLNRLTLDTRYQTSLQAVKDIVAEVGPQKVWLTGHSLGAAIALQIGKSAAREEWIPYEECLIEAYLFNPPYPSAPINMLTNAKYRARFHMASSFFTTVVSVVMKGTKKCDPFTKLCPWTPYLFVNPYDPLTCGYIGYFEHQAYMEQKGLSGIEKIAARDTVVSLVSGACGRDGEAHHLLPSAFLIKNLNPTNVEVKKAHGIHQWWEPFLNLQTQIYKFG